MPDKTYDILIDIRSRAAALDLTKELQSASKEAANFNAVFKASAAAGAQVTAQAREQVAILKAQATGQTGIVRVLEQQRAIQQETARLVQAGLSTREAQALAASKVALQADIASQATARRQQEAARAAAAAAQATAQQQQAGAIAAAQIAAQTRTETTREIAILQARAAGRKDIVKQLEREKALEAETNRLREKGLSLTEAKRFAQQKVNAEAQIAARTPGSGSLSGFAIGASVALTQQLLSLVTEIPRRMIEWISVGLRFNATLESARLGIAAVNVAFNPTSFRTFDAALKDSAGTVDLLKQKARETSATFEELLQGFQANVGPIFDAGISKSKEQVNIVLAASQAMAALAIPTFQLNQELRGVLSGDTSRISRLNQVLGVTKEQMEAATASGTAYQFLMGKLAPFVEAAKRGQDSFNVATSNTKDSLQQLAGVATEKIFGQIKESVLDLNKTLAEDKTAEKAAAIGSALGILAVKVKELAADSAKLVGADRFLENLENTEAGAAHFVANEQKRLLAIKEQIVTAEKSSKEEAAARLALDKEITDLTLRYSKAVDDGKAAAFVMLGWAKQMRGEFDGILGSARELPGQLNRSAEALEKAAKVAGVLQRIVDTVMGKSFELSGDTDAGFRLGTQIQLREARKAVLDAGGSEKQVEEAQLFIEQLRTQEFEKQKKEKLEALRLRRAEFEVTGLLANGEIAAANAKKDSIAIDRLALQLKKEYGNELSEEEARSIAENEIRNNRTIADQAAGKKNSQRELNALKREERDIMRDIQSQITAVSSNQFLFTAEKNAQLIPILQQEAEAHRLAGDQALEHAKKNEALALTFSGGVQANLVAWVNSLGTAAQAVSGIITNTLNTAIAATSQALTGLILGTKNWAQAFQQAGAAIIQSIIQVVLQFIAGQVAMFIIRQVFGKQEASVANKLASQSAAAWAPAAISASIASYGAASGFGVAAYIAALGLGTAAAVGASSAGGFEQGGYTGGGGSKAIAGVVHGQEFVQPRRTVDYYGLAIMEALRLRSIPKEKILELQAGLGNLRIPVARLGSFESGGAVADAALFGGVLDFRLPNESDQRGSSPAETKLSNYLVLDPTKLRKMIMEDGADEIWVTDLKSGRSYRLHGKLA